MAPAMTILDHFESAFRSASKDTFEWSPPILSKILVVTDLDADGSAAFEANVRPFLAGVVGQAEAAGVTPQWRLVTGSEYARVGELYELVQAWAPDLICTYRQLHSSAAAFEYSLGEFIHVLTQATTVPVLLTPNPQQRAAAEHALVNTDVVMAMTDHLPGSQRLVNFAAAMTEPRGKLGLSHVEDQLAYDRIMDAIGKIPQIETDVARELIRDKLLAQPADYVEACRAVIATHRPELEVKRVLFNEITKKGVQEGINNPRELDTILYEAQRTRRVLDRIGGYPLSNLLWRKLAFGLSAGRVQTPALRIIVDRQHEIDSFIPRPYWLLDAKLAGALPPAFTAALDSVGGEKLEKVSSRPAATSELDAKRFEEDLKVASYKVSKIIRRERKSRAPAPYTTSKLQQDASTRLGMNPQRTMRTAQGLYEGVSLGKGKDEEVVGLITYMRTDSLRLSAEAIDECRGFIEKTFGAAALPDKPNAFKSKSQNVQDAHEAIRPTRMDLPPEAVRKHLTDERFRLYKLIWDRFVACQMVPAVYDQTSVEIEASTSKLSYGLRASGSILKIAGWRAVYGAGDRTELAGEEGENPDDDQMSLTQLTEGELLNLT